MELDLTDPIDSVLAEMVTLNRRKRADYAKDDDPLSNFFRTAEIMRGKAQNETVRDNLLAAAVYAVLCVAVYDRTRPKGQEDA
jgi:hypothetical protein